MTLPLTFDLSTDARWKEDQREICALCFKGHNWYLMATPAWSGWFISRTSIPEFRFKKTTLICFELSLLYMLMLIESKTFCSSGSCLQEHPPCHIFQYCHVNHAISRETSLMPRPSRPWPNIDLMLPASERVHTQILLVFYFQKKIRS